MLKELQVKNFAIIDKLEIRFESGFNIISGETGAGKSVLLKSLSLLIGAKSDYEFIGTKHNCASVIGLFDLSHREDIQKKLKALGIDSSENEDQMSVRRRLSDNNKSQIYINDHLVTLTTLKNLIAPLLAISNQQAPLVEMTGQHESKNLLSKDYHLDLLDQFSSISDLRKLYSNELKKHREFTIQYQELTKNLQTRESDLDYLEFQKKEFEKYTFTEKEDEFLSEKIKQQRKLKNLSEDLNLLDQCCEEYRTHLGPILERVEKIYKESEEIKEIYSQMKQIDILVEDVLFMISKSNNESQSENYNVEEFEEKLDHLRKLQKKFGPELKDVLIYSKTLSEKINTLKESEQNHSLLKNKIFDSEILLSELSLKIYLKRKKQAVIFEKKVNQELKELNMQGVVFNINVSKTELFNDKMGSSAEFLLSNNGDTSQKSLSKYASGGELSRILLAIKNIISVSKYRRTYLFDEVDTGISGKTAQIVGKKLKNISKNQQVICITHLPQVACYADHHFLINKTSTKKNIEMNVLKLNKDKQQKEIARLISGSKIEESSMEHAKNLIESSTIH